MTDQIDQAINAVPQVEQRTLGIPLPNGRQVFMQVPADLTDEETHFLVGQILTLPAQLSAQNRKPRLYIPTGGIKPQ